MKRLLRALIDYLRPARDNLRLRIAIGRAMNAIEDGDIALAQIILLRAVAE